MLALHRDLHGAPSESNGIRPTHTVPLLLNCSPLSFPFFPCSAAAMFAVIRQVQQLKTATTVLISGPDDLPPGPGEFGAAVATVSAWTRNVGGSSC